MSNNLSVDVDLEIIFGKLNGLNKKINSYHGNKCKYCI